MRDLAAEGYRTETGDTWRPRNGSHSSQTGKLTSAAIDARDYLRAREHRETSAHLPEGTLVAFTGGKDFGDVTAIWRSLDSIKIKYEDMVLLHGGGPGAEKIAASWAEKNGVHQVVCKPNWDRDGKAAPFRRNDVLLNFLPKGLLAFRLASLRSVRRLYVGIQFSEHESNGRELDEASAFDSQSLASRRHAMVRSTTQRLGWTTKRFT